MAKAQKTVMIPEDLYRLIAHIEKTTGASFTRITVAALLQYLFTEPAGPNPSWMEHTVSLELGEIQVSDMPRERENEANAVALSHAQPVESEPNVLEIPHDDPAVWDAQQWMCMMQPQGDDAIAKIIGYWTRWSKRYPPAAVMPDTDSELSGSDAEPGKTD